MDRLELAAKCLPTVLQRHEKTRGVNEHPSYWRPMSPEWAAEEALEMADALIKAAEKKGK